MLRRFLKFLLRLFYRVEISGIEHFEAAGKRMMIVANHTSFLDGLLLACFLPEKLSFAINTHIAEKWYARLITPVVNLFAMDPTNPLSLKSLIRYVQGDQRVVIFPEGRITVTGALMKIYNGPGLVADRSGAMVLPVRIEGAQYTPFSRLRGRVRLRWFPKITIKVLPPRRIQAPEDVKGRARRKYAGQVLTDIMTHMMYETGNYNRTIVQGVLDAMSIHGRRHYVVEDIERQPLSYSQLLTRAFILGNKIKGQHSDGEFVGILLPNSVGTVTVFLGLQIYNRVPAMLNFSTGAQGMISACETAAIKTVYTSRRFIKLARLENSVAELEKHVNLVYLDDLVPTITLLDKLRGAINARFANSSYARKSRQAKPTDPAVVLFTSGSEGMPKGVVLSHANILANGVQMSTRIDFNAQDIIFNALPMFHSFGLSAGTLLPLLSGMRAFFYPSPLHYRIVPEMVYAVNATIMFGTNTFLKGYARFAHPYDFYSLRYVFAGAEKLHDDTRKIWSERFGVRILEGYGATETSPVLASNTAMENKTGSVGRLLPGIEYKLLPVPGVEEGGRLVVCGANVMLGYLLHEKTGIIEPPVSKELGKGWYDTGDIVTIDSDGFLRIQGRAKRFAKIGGEMVSLTAAEEFVSRVWQDKQHSVVAIPDQAKGEQLVLVTNQEQADRKSLTSAAREQGVSELNIPRKIIIVKDVPLLGTGKTDYPAVQALVTSELSV
ncbi:MAG: AMP-binding protein [Thioalkalispiraceae bacterium]|jgi:acyl-[acyl-carrier-protein]-phospholipid O-acyltransferase/long-chain-fatty-acid--[acyl-carrier-protein] ligase